MCRSAAPARRQGTAGGPFNRPLRRMGEAFRRTGREWVPPRDTVNTCAVSGCRVHGSVGDPRHAQDLSQLNKVIVLQLSETRISDAGLNQLKGAQKPETGARGRNQCDKAI